jgi:NADH-quinone oxidoreductase subunit J
MFETLVFYFFAAALIGSAGMVITVRNPVHAALFLVLAFFSSAGLWMLLEAEFLAITLVLVYVGAVMVLFLFVVMMLDINIAALREGFTRYLRVGGAVAILMMVAMVLVVGPGNFGPVKESAALRHPAGYSNTKELGEVLYTDYVFPFEIAAVILLVAIIAAIALTMRGKRQTKTQRPEEQVLASREGRVHLVKMTAEKKQ